MAIIILGASNCSLCNDLLLEDQDIVSFQHFIQDQDHPLWRYSDSGMHRKCFLSWESKKEFRVAYNKMRNQLSSNSNISHYMEQNGDVIITSVA